MSDQSKPAPAAPTAAALRAAKALCPILRESETSRSYHCEKAILIDRETGLPELLDALDMAYEQMRKVRQYLPTHGSFGEDGISDYETAQKLIRDALARAQGREPKP